MTTTPTPNLPPTTEAEHEAREHLLRLLLGDRLGLAEDLVHAAANAARETRTSHDVDAYADALSDLHLLRADGLARISKIEGIACGVALARRPCADPAVVEGLARATLTATLAEGGAYAAMDASAVVDGISAGLLRTAR